MIGRKKLYKTSSQSRKKISIENFLREKNEKRSGKEKERECLEKISQIRRISNEERQRGKIRNRHVTRETETEEERERDKKK